MWICLAYSATDGETNAYIRGYQTAQSNFSLVINSLEKHIQELETEIIQKDLIISNIVLEKDTYYSNQIANYSNFYLNSDLYKKAKYQRNQVGAFIIGKFVGNAEMAAYAFAFKEIVIPLLQYKF